MTRVKKNNPKNIVMSVSTLLFAGHFEQTEDQPVPCEPEASLGDFRAPLPSERLGTGPPI